MSAVEDDSGFSSAIDPQRRFTGEKRTGRVGPDEAVQQFRKQSKIAPVEQEAWISSPTTDDDSVISLSSVTPDETNVKKQTEEPNSEH